MRILAQFLQLENQQNETCLFFWTEVQALFWKLPPGSPRSTFYDQSITLKYAEDKPTSGMNQTSLRVPT